MPYKKREDLPDSVRHVLPAHAQDIYKEAFNSAFEQYGSDDEVRCHKIAWAAVKKVYHKDSNDKWIKS